MSEEIRTPLAQELRDLKKLPETLKNLDVKDENFADELTEAVDILLQNTDKCLEAHKVYREQEDELRIIASENRLLDEEIEKARLQIKNCKVDENKKFYRDFFSQTIKDYKSIIDKYDGQFIDADSTLESYVNGFKLNIEQLLKTLTFLGLHKEEAKEETQAEVEEDQRESSESTSSTNTDSTRKGSAHDNFNEETKRDSSQEFNEAQVNTDEEAKENK